MRATIKIKVGLLSLSSLIFLSLVCKVQFKQSSLPFVVLFLGSNGSWSKENFTYLQGEFTITKTGNSIRDFSLILAFESLDILGFYIFFDLSYFLFWILDLLDHHRKVLEAQTLSLSKIWVQVSLFFFTSKLHHTLIRAYRMTSNFL